MAVVRKNVDAPLQRLGKRALLRTAAAATLDALVEHLGKELPAIVANDCTGCFVDRDGLLPCATTDASSSEALTLATCIEITWIGP